jgi:hypothetical protein
MRRLHFLVKPLAFVGLVGLFALTPLAPAAAITMDQNNLIDDSVFDDTTTMDAAAIDAFLNTFPNSCISPNSGFQAQDPTGYSPSGGFTYGNYVSAGQVISDAAQAYGINPQVLLTTLQKEQSLVAGSGSSFCEDGDMNKYAAAVGYGCPDGGTVYSYSGISLYKRNGNVVSSVSSTCVNSAAKAGFSEQVIRAAWLLKFGEQRSEGNVSWSVIKGNWNNSDDPPTCYAGPMTQGAFQRCQGGPTVYYDGYTTIDSTSVHMDSGATAALYWYTPHFSGNQSFDNIFSNWFGSLFGDAIGPAVYRMYNPKTHDHFFTAKENERASAKALGYNDDASAVFKTAQTQLPGTVPIYNLHNGRLIDNWLLPDGIDFYWAVIDGGYANNGIAFYAYPANPNPTSNSPLCPSGSTPVYQMWQGGYTDHFYSINGSDHYWGLVDGGYIDDGSSAYKDANGGVSFCVPQ